MPDPRRLLDHDVVCGKIAILWHFYVAIYGNVRPSGVVGEFGRSNGQLLKTSKSVHVLPEHNFVGAANVGMRFNQRRHAAITSPVASHDSNGARNSSYASR